MLSHWEFSAFWLAQVSIDSVFPVRASAGTGVPTIKTRLKQLNNSTARPRFCLDMSTSLKRVIRVSDRIQVFPGLNVIIGDGNFHNSLVLFTLRQY
jgi:hypothetical protein